MAAATTTVTVLSTKSIMDTVKYFWGINVRRLWCKLV